MRKAWRFLQLAWVFVVWVLRPDRATSAYTALLRRRGMEIAGQPNYISALVWFDGADYSLISLGDGVTISSNVRFLVHDWAALTVSPEIPRGPWMHREIKRIVIGARTFIGTGSIILPGAEIGERCIIGAGTVVRGRIPDGSVVIGNPAVVISSTDEYLTKRGIQTSI